MTTVDKMLSESKLYFLGVQSILSLSVPHFGLNSYVGDNNCYETHHTAGHLDQAIEDAGHYGRPPAPCQQ